MNPFLTMYTGSLHGKDVVFASPGVGMVFAATAVTTMIDKYNIVAVIFTGVAGGLKPKTKVGQTTHVVNVSESVLSAPCTVCRVPCTVCRVPCTVPCTSNVN